MPVSALTLECARLQVAAYNPAFLATGQVDLSPFSRTKVATIWSADPGGQRVRHGFIAVPAPAGAGELPRPVTWSFAGTLEPKGRKFSEWLTFDFDARLVDDPWGLGERVHAGFLDFYRGLTVVNDATGVELPVPDFMAANPSLVAGSVFEGHSLGTSPATYALLEALLKGLRPAGTVVFAAPRPGDGAFRRRFIATVQQFEGFFEAWANPNDEVPKVPFTVKEPFNLWDFEPIVEPEFAPADAATPAIPADWASSHHMPSYLSILQALYDAAQWGRLP